MTAIDGNKSIVEQRPVTSEVTAPQASQASQAPNSVYEVENQNTEKKGTPVDTTKLEKMLEEVANKFQKYGITVEDLKKFHHVNRLFQLTEENIKNLSEKEREESIKRLKESLIQALNDCKDKNGNINIAEAEELAHKYNIGLESGWKLKDFKKAQQEIPTTGLVQKLIDLKLLQDDAENITPEDIKKAIKEACEKVLGKLETKPDQKKVKEQFKKFGLLLANSTEDEKRYFDEVIANLYTENRLSGLKLLFQSIKDEEDVQEIADEFAAKGATQRISAGITPEKTTEIAIEITSRNSDEGLTVGHKVNDAAYHTWFNENKEAIEELNKKILEAKEQGIEPQLTDAEKELQAQAKRFTSIATGENIGTLLNQNISTEFKEEHLSTLNSDAYKRDDYRDILVQTHDYIEEHKEELINLPQNYKTLLNNATNENYDRVNDPNRSSEELKAPSAPKSEDTGATADVGFVSRRPANPGRVEELKAQYIQPTDRAAEFKVDKNVTSPMKDKNEMGTKFKDAKTAQDKLALIKRYYDKSPLLRAGLEQYLSIVPDPLRTLNALPTNAREDLARTLVRKGKLNEEEINALNLSYGAKQLLLNDLQMIKKNEEAQK